MFARFKSLVTELYVIKKLCPAHSVHISSCAPYFKYNDVLKDNDKEIENMPKRFVLSWNKFKQVSQKSHNWNPIGRKKSFNKSRIFSQRKGLIICYC